MGLITPERYSHDKLRQDLSQLDTVMRLLGECVRKEDAEGVKVYYLEIQELMKHFYVDFEEHDVEMGFVEKIVNEHKEMLRKEMENKKKWELLLKIRNIVLSISGIIGLYFTIKGII